MNKKSVVCVIFGGQSSEHDISKLSAYYVLNNIDTSLFEVIMVGITKEGKWLPFNGSLSMLLSDEWIEFSKKNFIAKKNIAKINFTNGFSLNDYLNFFSLNKIDVIFPVLHGCNGEDGTIQGLFQLANIPYVGCNVLSSAISMDKTYSKLLVEKTGVKVAKYISLTKKSIDINIDSVVNNIEGCIPYPCFVKPSNSGSSIGVGKATNKEELIQALEKAILFDNKVLVEEFIDGREIECSVLGNTKPLVSFPGEIIAGNDFYDFDAKYNNNGSKTLIPAKLESATIKKLTILSRKIYDTLGCTGLSRIDFFICNRTNDIYFNEINTMPGFTNISMYPKLWEASGISFKYLVKKLIDLALEIHKDKTIYQKKYNVRDL